MFFLPSSLRQGIDPLEEAIFRASHEGDLRRMQNLVVDHPNVNFTARNGSTPLCCASYKGFLHCVQWLVQSAGADFHQTTRDAYAITPLYAAAQEGHTQIVQFLISHGADYQSKNWQTGYSPLQISALQGHDDTVRCIASELGNVTLQKSGEGQKALLLAFMKGHYAAMEFLIQEVGISPDFHFANGMTPLCHAITKRNLPMIDFLIRMGADVNLTTLPTASQSALKFLWGRLTVVLASDHSSSASSSSLWHRLTRFGQNKRHCDCTPLETAIVQRDSEIVCLLLKNGAEVDIRHVDGHASCVLKTAIKTGCLPVVQALVEHGALKKDNQLSALLTACRTGQVTIFRYLVWHGSAARVFQGAFPYRLLATACERQYQDIAYFILGQTMCRELLLGGIR